MQNEGTDTVKCDVCGGNAGILTSKLGDGRWICGSCLKKAGGVSAIFKLREMRTPEIKSLIFGENASVANDGFHTSQQFGKLLKIDEAAEMIEIPLEAMSQSRAIRQALQKGRITDTYIKFSDLVGVDLIENGSLVTSGGLGSALTGAALFGNTGMIAGGLVGKKKISDVCESLQIKLTVNDLNNPAIFIDVVRSRMAKKSLKYQTDFELAQKIVSVLNVIIQRNHKS